MKTPAARSGASIVRCRPTDDTVVQVGRDRAIVDLRLRIVAVAHADEAGTVLLERLSAALLARLEMKADPRIAVRRRTHLLMPHRCAPLWSAALTIPQRALPLQLDEGAC